MISIVIPTLNAANHLPKVMNALVPGTICGLVKELLVVDGGSTDITTALTEAAGAITILSEQGRGPQLAKGGQEAKADWLMFLHADTILTDGWEKEVEEFINSGNKQKAAIFRFSLDDPRKRARILEFIVKLRCIFFALPYGDQGILISRQLYEEIGGFKPLVLMEDVDIVRRIGRSRLHYFQTKAITSADRYKRDGYLARVARNAKCLTLWFVGVSPEKILEKYQ